LIVFEALLGAAGFLLRLDDIGGLSCEWLFSVRPCTRKEAE
jgi:hypothetical protein